MNVIDFPRKFSSLRTEIFYDRDDDEISDIDPSTLSELCATKLVSNHSIIPEKRALPQPIQQILWDSAVRHNRDLAIRRLMTTWKDSTVHLRPPLAFDTWRLFCWANNDILDQISKQQSIVLTVIDCVMNSLQMHLDIHETIQCIDLRELPVTDTVILKICNNIKTLCRLQKLPKHCSSRTKEDRYKVRKCSCYSTSKVVIRLNCIIKKSKMMMVLCEAWVAGKNGSSPVELEISSLRIMPEAFCEPALGCLSVLDPNFIEVFNCSFCHLPNVSHFALYNHLKSFQNLKTLDLTYIALDSVRNPEIIAVLAEVLQTLTRLEQLHLSFSRITGCLQMLLAKVNQLKHLGIYCCFLGKSDFLFLSQSHHATALRNLEISGNGLTLEW